MIRPITPEYRNHIGKLLTNRLGEAMQRGEIEKKDVSMVCSYILPVIDTITTYEGLVRFFDKLASAWPFFGDIVKREQQEPVAFVGKGSA